MTSRELFRADRLLESSNETGPILGLETGTPTTSLAILNQGRVLAQRDRASASHCAGLVGDVDDLLREAGLKPNQLRAVAVGTGPGSFTGLRIGLSYAKGLALAGDLPLA